jgi:hypothetical protein
LPRQDPEKAPVCAGQIAQQVVSRLDILRGRQPAGDCQADQRDDGPGVKTKGRIDLAEEAADDRPQEIAHPLAGGNVGLHLALSRAGRHLKGRGQRKGPENGAHQPQQELGKDQARRARCLAVEHAGDSTETKIGDHRPFAPASVGYAGQWRAEQQGGNARNGLYQADGGLGSVQPGQAQGHQGVDQSLESGKGKHHQAEHDHFAPDRGACEHTSIDSGHTRLQFRDTNGGYYSTRAC